MRKGYLRQLTGTEELFHLPAVLEVERVEHRFSESATSHRHLRQQQVQLSPAVSTFSASLLRPLLSCFGLEYFSLGLLKFFGDSLNFAGPIILSRLVGFMEDKNQPVTNGYLYALAMFCTTLLSAVFGIHFAFRMSTIGLMMRAAILTTVYNKVLRTSAANLSRFSSGQITNFMSTDADRVINFCPSFHDLWSLPLQVGISFYLLYQQVGVSFLAGVVFAIILIPINRKIAMKIGDYSTLMMQSKDARVKAMTELLLGIRVIKLSAWEDRFQQKVNACRHAELKCLKARKYLDALCVYLWASATILVSVLTFTTYVLLGNRLTAAKVFTSIAVFNILIRPLNAFPWVVNGMVEAWVSAKRLQEFLATEEVDYALYYTTDELTDPSAAVCILSGCFDWHSPQNVSETESTKSTFALRGINLAAKKGKLTGIIGATGSGKSSLLCAVLGELRRSFGAVSLANSPGGAALVAQETWAQHGSVRENILFGSAYDSERYWKVIEACALKQDIERMPQKDETEIGEQGVTLSGGQKARLALARAVYQDKELYILDDPIAAVDVNVARHIFNFCIRGILRQKTVLFATHHLSFLLEADEVVWIRDGRVVAQGVPVDVLPMWTTSVEGGCAVTPLEEKTAWFPSDPNKSTAASENLINTKQDDKVESEADTTLSDADPILVGQEPVLVHEEEKQIGAVKLHVYGVYFKAVGYFLVFLIFISLALMQGSKNASDWWLSYWVSHEAQNKSLEFDYAVDYNLSRVLSGHLRTISLQSYPLPLFFVLHYGEESDHLSMLKPIPESLGTNGEAASGQGFESEQNRSSLNFYLVVYASLAGVNTLFTLARAFLFAYGGVVAARRIHEKLFTKILVLPIRFFDVTPVGRLVNRFSSDLYTVDDSLPFQANILLAYAFSIVSTLVMMCYGLPWFSICIIPMAVLYYSIQNYYRYTTCELKRLSSISLSPIYCHFTDTLNGKITIRAFRAVPRFMEENRRRLTNNLRAQYSQLACSTWLNSRLQLLGIFMVSAIALIAVLQHKYQSVDPGLVGLAISYALSITGLLAGGITVFTETEKELVSVERISHYIEETAAERSGGMALSSQLWPLNGAIEFVDVSLRYAKELPLAICSVSLSFTPGEKIGIVGRTGSGKSSLFQSLLRTVELETGFILIDSIDIAHVSLKALRRSIAIIPQNPFLFSGSLRQNLDIDNEYDDQEIQWVIKLCSLNDIVTRLGSLSSDVGERGSMLSVGEKQLVCLARALLKQSKIVCLDEATAYIDPETDRKIQETIWRSFPLATVLTVAHRINTVIDCDRIVVMESGRVLEFGTPAELLKRPAGQFANLVKTSYSGAKPV